ncbi:hypothetical protein LCGC14_3022050, partial [marine sediment metagenome]
TSEVSPDLTDSDTSYDIHAVVSTDVTTGATKRLILRLYANVGSGGSNSIVTVTMEGVTDSHLTVGVPSDVWQLRGDVLDDLNILGVVGANSEFLVGTGVGAFAWESGATVRTSLGLGTADSVTFSTVAWSGGSSANANSAFAHISADGSSHTFIDQDVTITGTPTFDSLTVTNGATFDTDTLVVDEVNHTVEPKILELVTTTSSITGVIRKGTDRFIHDFHHPTGGGAIPVGNNTFVGVNAGNFTMGSTATQTFHSSTNTAMGNGSFRSNTKGFHNNATGERSLGANTTGFFNNAMGSSALRSNTTGVSNNAMGYFSLKNADASYNTAVGSQSGESLTTGASNIFLGNQAGNRQTSNSNL